MSRPFARRRRARLISHGHGVRAFRASSHLRKRALGQCAPIAVAIPGLSCWCEGRFAPISFAIARTSRRCPGGRIWSSGRRVSQSSVTATSGTGAIGSVFAPNSRAVQTLTTGSPRLRQIGPGMSYSGGPCERRAGWSSGFGRARSVGTRTRLRARLLPHSNPRTAQRPLERLKESATLTDLADGKVRAPAEVRAETDFRHLAWQILRDCRDHMRLEEP